jgi:hypothetical protein
MGCEMMIEDPRLRERLAQMEAQIERDLRHIRQTRRDIQRTLAELASR